MNIFQEILKNIDIVIQYQDIIKKDLTQVQIDSLQEIAKSIPNPDKMTLQETLNVFKRISNLNIDILKLETNYKSIMEQRNKDKNKNS
jgi:hypothetical protein